MQASVYLGDLGGLSAHRQLIRLDLRGTGQSALPAEAASYRCDRLVEDVDCLRKHLGLDMIDLLAHSAGANLAALYVGRHPDRVRRLALITPSVVAVGITITGDVRRETAQLRRDEPWFPAAFAALEAIVTGGETADSFDAIAPFFHGRWDEAARAHRAAEDRQKNKEAAVIFGAEGAFDADMTRAALARFASPVLVLTGTVDLASPPRAMVELAELFPHVELVIQSGAGHFPWRDDDEQFVAVTAGFLG